MGIKSGTAVVVIPARAGSTRYPNKPLALIHDRPMIQYVWEACTRAQEVSQVWVATDSKEIYRRVLDFGGQAVLTSREFRSGTDRVAYVAREMEADWVLNVQGDEPLISPQDIDAMVRELRRDPETEMVTLGIPLADAERLKDPNTVKVVVDGEGWALYFSRQPLCSRSNGRFTKHLGIYGFSHQALMRFVQLPEGVLERVEGLEQLRALQYGMRIRVIFASQDTISVDTFRDIARVEEYLSMRP